MKTHTGMDLQTPPQHLEPAAQQTWVLTVNGHAHGYFQGKEAGLEAYCVSVVRRDALEAAYAEYRERYPDDLREHERFERRIERADRRVRANAQAIGISGRLLAKKEQLSAYVPAWGYIRADGVIVDHNDPDLPGPNWFAIAEGELLEQRDAEWQAGTWPGPTEAEIRARAAELSAQFKTELGYLQSLGLAGPWTAASR